MDELEKQKIAMLLVIVVLTITAVGFYSDRIKVTEITTDYTKMSENDIHRQELSENSYEYKLLKKSTDRLLIYQKSLKIEKGSNNTFFYSIHNEQPITTTFWLSNVECNDGSTVFFNPKYDAFEKMVMLEKSTKVFPLRIYYPSLNINSVSSFNCNIHVSSGFSEYASESIILILDPSSS